jgi:hypothetical protein
VKSGERTSQTVEFVVFSCLPAEMKSFIDITKQKTSVEKLMVRDSLLH